MSQAMDYNDLVFIVDHLSRTAVQQLSGAGRRTDVEAWLALRTAPSDEQVARINFAANLFKELSNRQGVKFTHEWFFNSPIGSANTSPLDAIRNDLFDEVRREAALLTNTVVEHHQD